MEHKAEYVKKPKNVATQTEKDCVICKIILYDESIQRMEIFRNDLVIVFLNIYPYTTGHLLISPLRHITGFEEMSGEELRDFSIVSQRIIRMLQHFSKTDSFNVGWNQGPWSGGSIAHFHSHLVPRYKNDMSFVDIIVKTRPVLHSLESVEQELIKYQPFLAGEKTIAELGL